MKRGLQVCVQFRSGPGASCAARYDGSLLDEVTRLLQAEKLDVDVSPINCFVKCEMGPNIKLMPDGKFWNRVSRETLSEVIEFIKKQAD